MRQRPESSRRPGRQLRSAVAVIAVAALLGACGSDDTDDSAASADVERWWIEPDLVDCEGGAGPQTCWLVATSEDGEPTLFYDSVAGFEFDEGTAYVIDVRVSEVDDPPADGSSLSYELVEVIEENPGG